MGKGKSMKLIRRIKRLIYCGFPVMRDQFLFNIHKKKHHDMKKEFCPCGRCYGYQFRCICGMVLNHHCTH